MAEERRLATVSRPQQQQVGQALDLHSLRHNLTTPTSDDMYSVNKKSRPGVRIARALAHDSNISREILLCEKNDKEARSRVRGWIGPKNNPTLQTESEVIERYDDLLRQAIFDAIDNGMFIPTGRRDNYGRLETKKAIPDFEFGPDGFPVFKDKWAQFQLMKNHLNKIKFAERSTAGKAERNVIFALLGKDDDGVGEEVEEKPVAVEKPTHEDDEMEGYRNRIRNLLMKAHEGNKDTARDHFVSVCVTLDMKATAPADLTTIADAKRVLEEIMEQTQQSRPVDDVEVMDDDDVNGPITAEEGARFTHDQ